VGRAADKTLGTVNIALFDWKSPPVWVQGVDVRRARNADLPIG
jgi:hypothetical protein